jgi:hypothetical protein
MVMLDGSLAQMHRLLAQERGKFGRCVIGVAYGVAESRMQGQVACGWLPD